MGQLINDSQFNNCVSPLQRIYSKHMHQVSMFHIHCADLSSIKVSVKLIEMRKCMWKRPALIYAKIEKKCILNCTLTMEKPE